MRTLILITFFLCLGNISRSQDTINLNLKQCIDIALKNNVDLFRSQSLADISSQNLWQSRVAFLPSLNGYISQGQNAGKSINPYTNTFINQKIITGQYGLSSNMILWSGFNNYNSMRQSSFSNKAFEMDLEQAKLDLVLNVTTAYLQVLSNEEIVGLTTSQLDLSQKQVGRLSILEKNNSVSPNIIYDTKGQLANDKLSLIDAKNSLETSMINLAQILNLPDTRPLKLEKINAETTDNNSSTESINQNALQKLPLVKASEFRMMSAKKNLHASQGAFFPTLSLNGSIGSNYSDAASIQRYTYDTDASSDNYVVVNNVKTPVYVPQYNISQEKINLPDQVKNNLNSYVGLTLQVPIFNSFRTKTQIGISKINFELMQAQNKNTLNKLGLNIKQAYVNMLSARERLQVIKEQSEFYAESFKIAISKFDTGLITIVDYSFAKNNSNRADLNYIILKYDYYLKIKTLEYFNGDLKF